MESEQDQEIQFGQSVHDASGKLGHDQCDRLVCGGIHGGQEFVEFVVIEKLRDSG